MECERESDAASKWVLIVYIQVAVHTKQKPKNNLVFMFTFAKCKWTNAVKHGDTTTVFVNIKL